jgi:hypothetical protein
MITDHPISNLITDEEVLDHSFSYEPGSEQALAFIAAIREAQASVKRGECIPFEEFEKEIDSWIID